MKLYPIPPDVTHMAPLFSSDRESTPIHVIVTSAGPYSASTSCNQARKESVIENFLSYFRDFHFFPNLYLLTERQLIHNVIHR